MFFKIFYLVEELLAVGTLLLLLPRRLAKPGPASAPRPPAIQKKHFPESVKQYLKSPSPLLFDKLILTLSDLQIEDLVEKVRTDPAKSSWSNKLHELVVAHVTQKALQTAFPLT